MRSITRLFGAFGALADSLLSLAGVLDGVTAKLRMQLAGEIDAPVVDQNNNGQTLSNTARLSGVLPGESQIDAAGENAPASANGRKKARAGV